ncbi:MAG: type II toxin-antitoxin system HicA family toxin [Bryobacteraceae bacterium]
MAKFPALKPKDVLRALTNAGFILTTKQAAMPVFFHRARSDLRVTIPIHNKDLPIGTLKSILEAVTPKN